MNELNYLLSCFRNSNRETDRTWEWYISSDWCLCGCDLAHCSDYYRRYYHHGQEVSTGLYMCDFTKMFKIFVGLLITGADFQDYKWGSPWRMAIRWRVRNTHWDLFTEQKSEDSLKLRYLKLFLDSKMNNFKDTIMFKVHFQHKNILDACEIGVSCF